MSGSVKHKKCEFEKCNRFKVYDELPEDHPLNNNCTAFTNVKNCIMNGGITKNWTDLKPDMKTITEARESIRKGETVSGDQVVSEAGSALDVQISGNHYKQFVIQPIQFIYMNKLDFLQGNIIKYTCRYKNKNGIEDLKKVKHYVDLLIELEYGKQDV
jgi:uncharacterized protein DUF3310